ncbi:glycosyltransferase family 2 protein, partial [Escherichia coli]|nr:glycosyltransferase family 2 protein [Escherichia coli]
CKYITIFPVQRRKWVYLKFLCRGIVHGVKGISGKFH